MLNSRRVSPHAFGKKKVVVVVVLVVVVVVVVIVVVLVVVGTRASPDTSFKQLFNKKLASLA